ncbi:MAG: transglycosylase domain-containing protein [Spirochaetia bacterium]|jgi:penicillin-binding protein 1C
MRAFDTTCRRITGLARRLAARARQATWAARRAALASWRAVRAAWAVAALAFLPAWVPWSIACLLFCPLLALLAVGAGRAVLFSPPATPIIEDRDGNFLTEGAGVYPAFGYWDVQGALNKRIVDCVTAVEDRRFYGHPGVDLISLGRSILNNASGRARQGGSTIAMQVARLEYPADRTLLNKALEMSTAVLLVLRFGHEKVMRHYLKIVPQGNQIYGVAYSARRFFRKPLSDVTLAEAALLAALPREPGRMNVFSWFGFLRAKERARMILSLLERRGHVGQEEYAAAIRELSHLPFPTREVRPANSYHFVLRLLAEEKSRGRASYAKPLRSSLDPAIQDFISSVAESALRENRRLDAHNIAIIVAERTTGEVLGYIGSGSFFDRENSGSIDYARTPRSSGSILKPLLFALGLDSGHFTPASVLPDLPFFVLSAQGEYRAMNFDDAYLGPMLYRRALANSRNVPALRVLEGVGLREFYELARRMELARDQSHDASYYGYGLAIGGLYVTLSDLVAAYGTLANDGRALGLGFLRGETGGKAPRQVFSPYAAREVGLFLSDDAARLPSFPRMSVLEFPFPVAIKTGTSQGFRDAWTVAYSARYVVGLWMGNPDNHPMNHVAGIVSAVYVARILHFLHPLQEQGIDAAPFPVPEAAESVRICSLSGEAAGADCASTVVEHFRPGEAPRSLCSVHRRYAVDTRDGSPATRATPPARVALRPFSVLPAVYALWGARHGYGDVPRETDAAGGRFIAITYPQTGARYLLDPDLPKRFQTVPLEASVSPRVRAIIWYADGNPVAKVGFPYAARLPLTRGVHEIQVVIPGMQEHSAPVTIRVE